MKKERMLITGGCGFIGSHFTDFQMGYVDMEVIVVDKLTYASNIDYLPEGAKLIKKDINDLTPGPSAPTTTPTPPPTARTQVSRSRPASTAKPAASVRKRTGGPSLYQKSKRAVRSTPGDPGRTATDRLKYMAARGNRASQKALRGPKKNWRSSVFEPQN